MYQFAEFGDWHIGSVGIAEYRSESLSGPFSVYGDQIGNSLNEFAIVAVIDSTPLIRNPSQQFHDGCLISIHKMGNVIGATDFLRCANEDKGTPLASNFMVEATTRIYIEVVVEKLRHSFRYAQIDL